VRGEKLQAILSIQKISKTLVISSSWLFGGIMLTLGEAHCESLATPTIFRSDMRPWQEDMRRQIRKAWFPPKGNESKRVVVKYIVHKDGRLSDLEIMTSSGVAIADQAALRAVENAAPFRPLPAVTEENLEMQFTFDYNVFTEGLSDNVHARELRNAKVTSLLRTGQAYETEKKYDQAIAMFKRALQADPQSDSVWRELGAAYQAKGDWENALQCYQQANKINPESAIPGNCKPTVLREQL
jgi:TonB family protein